MAALAVSGLSMLAGCAGGTGTAPVSGGHAGKGAVPAAEARPGPEAATAVGAVRAMFAAYAAKDLPRWLGSWSDQGFVDAFGVPKAEAALVPPSWGDSRSFRESVVTLDGISEERIGTGKGSVVVETSESGVVTWHRLDLVRAAGRWRVAGRTPVAGPATDRPALDVTLADRSIRLGGSVVGRDLDLRVVNAGSTRHELVLLRRRGGVDETVGRMSPLEAGSGSTMVLRGLSPGDYSVVCNLVDADGRPHSASGMRAVLTVE